MKESKLIFHDCEDCYYLPASADTEPCDGCMLYDFLVTAIPLGELQ